MLFKKKNVVIIHPMSYFSPRLGVVFLRLRKLDNADGIGEGATFFLHMMIMMRMTMMMNMTF